MINPLNRLIYTLTLSVILAAVLWAGVAQWRLQQAQKQAAAAELADAKAEIARLSGSLQIESQRAAAYRSPPHRRLSNSMLNGTDKVRHKY